MKHVAVIAILLVAGGCESDGGSFDLPDWSDGFTADGGTDPGADGGSVTTSGRLVVKLANEPVYEHRFGLADDSDQDCAIDTEDASFTEVDCQAEVNELDLFALGFAYTVGVPPQACEYLQISSYMFQSWTVGDGPALVHYKVDESGKFLEDVANSINGVPYCMFDHETLRPELPGAPNCCLGTYQVLVTVVLDAGGEVDLPLTTAKAWGGRVGDCYAGAAYASSLTSISEITGLPRDTIVDLDKDVYNEVTVSFTSPIELDFTTLNVQLANYLDPADEIPVAYQGAFSQPYYQIECLDQAHEKYASFRLVVREWDEVAEFEAEGDPDSGKKENAGAPVPMESNGSGSPINDYWDWSDLAVDLVDWVRIIR